MNADLRELRLEFEELLFREAEMLDSGRFEEWLELFDEGARYFAPVRATLPRGQEDFGRKELVAHFDDDKNGLIARVKRLRTGWAHAEEPPSRTRHLVSNVRIVATNPDAHTVSVGSNFIAFRSAGDSDERIFVGRREDTWRESDGAWRLLNRLIIFDHNVIQAISIFF